MTSYEAEYIKGAFDERKRIRKEVVELVNSDKPITASDLMDIIDGKARK